MEALIVGDTHFGKISKFFPAKRGLRYQFQALDDAYRYAINHGIGHIIIPGDIFEDPYPEHKTVRLLARFLKERDSVKYFLTRGNHDFQEIERHSLEAIEWAITDFGALKHVRIFLSPELVKLDGVPFLFMPYPYHDISRWLKPKDFAIVVPHLEFKGAKLDTGKVSDAGHSIPEGKQFWISGHLHTKQEYLKRRLVYPGTMGQINVVESPEKFFLHLTVYGRQVDCRFIPYTPPWRLSNLVIAKTEDLKQVTKDKHHAYRLIIKDGVEIPDDFFANHPNVYRHVGYRNKASLRAAMEGNLDIEENPAEQMDPLSDLEPFLLDKGLPHKTVKKCYREAKAIARELRL